MIVTSVIAPPMQSQGNNTIQNCFSKHKKQLSVDFVFMMRNFS
jgi:hypothetical protein